MTQTARHPVPVPDQVGAPDRDARLRRIVRDHYAFLWRSLRRLGVPAAAAEDAAQMVLCVVAKRLDEIEAGREKAFLFGVAMRIAIGARRRAAAEDARATDDLLVRLPAPNTDPGDRIDDERARRVLDAILDAMPIDLRAVLVLHEIEELTMAEIADALDLPAGTVASRLRRARELFERLAQRVRGGP
jgi:RNA polymerase sigma-70 factor (ECF subfamily)